MQGLKSMNLNWFVTGLISISLKKLASICSAADGALFHLGRFNSLLPDLFSLFVIVTNSLTFFRNCYEILNDRWTVRAMLFFLLQRKITVSKRWQVTSYLLMWPKACTQVSYQCLHLAVPHSSLFIAPVLRAKHSAWLCIHDIPYSIILSRVNCFYCIPAETKAFLVRLP